MSWMGDEGALIFKKIIRKNFFGESRAETLDWCALLIKVLLCRHICLCLPTYIQNTGPWDVVWFLIWTQIHGASIILLSQNSSFFFWAFILCGHYYYILFLSSWIPPSVVSIWLSRRLWLQSAPPRPLWHGLMGVKSTSDVLPSLRLPAL